MWFGFTPGRGTTDGIFILTEIQEKYIGKNRNLNFAFADPDLRQVAQKGPMVDFRKVSISERIVRVVQMYQNARSRVRINNLYSDVIKVHVGVHQSSLLSPLLFIIVLEALSQEFETGCPWELLLTT